MAQVVTARRAGLQAMIDRCRRAGGDGGEIVLPAGDYYVDETLLISSTRGLRFRGQSKYGTRLYWVGPDDVPMFKFDYCGDCVLSDLAIECNTDLLTAIENGEDVGRLGTNYGGTSIRASRLLVQDVVVQGNNILGKVFHAKLYDVDAKNDFHRLIRVEGKGFVDGFVFEGDQGVLHLVEACHLQGNQTGERGIVNDSGGVLCKDTALILCSDVCFDQLSHGTFVKIENFYSEQSSRFLRIADGFTFPLTVDGGYWHAGDEQAADAEIVQNYCDGPITIRGVKWGLNTSYARRFRHEPENGVGSLVFTGNVVRASNSFGHFPARHPNVSEGNQLSTGTVGDLLTPFDNTLFCPTRRQDWTDRGLPVPDIWALCQETSAPGDIFNVNDRCIIAGNLSAPSVAPTYKSTVTGFGGYWLEFTEAANQRISIDDDRFDFSTTNGLAFYCAFKIDSADNTDYLAFLGGGSTGPHVRFDNSGFIQLRANNANFATGTYDYRDAAAHRALIVLDPYDAAPYRFQVFTDAEPAGVGGTGAAPVLNAGGIGFGSWGASVDSFDGFLRMYAIYRGPIVKSLGANFIEKMAA